MQPAHSSAARADEAAAPIATTWKEVVLTMSFIVKCIVVPLQLMYDALMWQKLSKNPLYSDKLYEATTTTPTNGVYNFYILSLIAFGAIAWMGGLNRIFCAILGLSLLLAILIDRSPWNQKVSLKDMPRQVWRYLRLLIQVMRTELLLLIVASAFVYGIAKPITRSLDLFGGNTFLVLYGVYLAIRIVVFCRYLLIVAFQWDTYNAPPFEIRKANFRDRSTAVRHLTWSFLLGNIGLVVRCGYYDMTVSLFDSFYEAVGYPEIGGLWGFALAALVIVLWLVVADVRLGNTYYKAHRALHEDSVLYVSVHRIHHYAVYPTVLDSGTINPAEFLMTESGSIWFAPLPDWYWFAFQMCMLFGHFEGHHTVAEDKHHAEHFQFHVLHHRLYQCNYGMPAMDEKYNTLVTWSEFLDSKSKPED